MLLGVIRSRLSLDSRSARERGRMVKTMVKSLFMTVTALFTVVIVSGGCGSTGPDLSPPLVPEGFRVHFAGDGEITLKWTANRERDLAGYHLYRTTDLLAGYVQHATLDPDTISHSDIGLEYSIQYFYTLTAFDKSGN